MAESRDSERRWWLGTSSGWWDFCTRYWVVLFVVCVGVVVSWSAHVSYVRAAEIQQTRAAIRSAEVQHDEIIARFKGYERVLGYMRGYMQSSDRVDQGEWSGFVKYADLETRFPGVWGFAYIERVRAGELGSFIRRMHEEGVESFAVRTHNGAVFDGGEDEDFIDDRERYILKFEEPYERNSGVIGLDISSSETNRAVYDLATDSGIARLSDPFVLAQREGLDVPGLVMAMPVYESGVALETIQQRREAVRGWVSVALDMDYFAKHAKVISEDTDELRLRIEASDVGAVELFHTKRESDEECDGCDVEHTGISASFVSQVSGKDFISTIVTGSGHAASSHATYEFDENMRKANQVLSLGLRLTLVVILVTLVIEYVRIRADRIAGRITSSLLKSERKQRAFAYNAQAANKAKSAFLANMSHEIRSPMTSVLGYTELLAELVEEGGGKHEMRHALDRIDRAGSHLLHVVNDVLDVSKIESGKLPVRMVACQIGEVLSEVVGVMRVRASEAGLGLAVEFETGVPGRVMTDPYRVRQILLNLVGNAIKFTKEGGVRISVGCDADSLSFSVHDTGVGMRSDRIEAVFEPFEQDDSLQDSSNIGTGLGLSISRQLSEMMGGKLTAASVLGEGSVFTCRLPIRVPDDDVVDALKAWGGAAMIDCLPCEATVRRGRKELISGIGGRVLVAEDGEDNQRLIGHFLAKGGVEAVFVENGQEAIDVIENGVGFDFGFDLIILDIQMPVMDGYEAARTLRERGCTIPILALTANAMSGDRERCIDAGCDEYETKPVNRARLLRTVARMMGRLVDEADGGDGARAA